MSALTETLKSWGAAVLGKVEYLLSYACAGPHTQIGALQAHGQQGVQVSHTHAINTLQGKLGLLVVVVI